MSVSEPDAAVSAGLLTRSQEGVVHAHLVAGADAAARYTVGEAVELESRAPIDAPLLARAIEQAVAEAPRWSLRVDTDGGVRVLDPGVHAGEAAGAACEIRDLRGRPRPWPEAVAGMRADLATGIGFGAEALHRQRLWVLSEHRVVWSLLAHHVLVDGYGAVLLARRALEIFDARRAGRRCRPRGSPTPLGSPPPSGTTKAPRRMRAIASSGCAQTDPRRRRARCARCCRRRRAMTRGATARPAPPRLSGLAGLSWPAGLSGAAGSPWAPPNSTPPPTDSA